MAKDEVTVAVAEVAVDEAPSGDRFETFRRFGPDGTLYEVRRNIDTGEQTISVVDAP